MTVQTDRSHAAASVAYWLALAAMLLVALLPALYSLQIH